VLTTEQCFLLHSSIYIL